MSTQSGQSLLEVVTASAVGILVVAALTYATIFSLRNATFAKNSAQATKLAQEGIEKVRSIRDRNSNILTSILWLNPIRNVNIFSELFAMDLSHTKCNTVAGDTPCYFRFVYDAVTHSDVLTQGTNADFESVGSFNRQILIGDLTVSSCGTSDYDKYCNQKEVTVIVRWTDFAGTHESRLTTILRKI